MEGKWGTKNKYMTFPLHIYQWTSHSTTYCALHTYCVSFTTLLLRTNGQTRPNWHCANIQCVENITFKYWILKLCLNFVHEISAFCEGTWTKRSTQLCKLVANTIPLCYCIQIPYIPVPSQHSVFYLLSETTVVYQFGVKILSSF